MEKFGIFDLLDTLSAIAEQDESAPAPSAEDAIFSPPAYAPPQKQPANRDALNGFLAQHEAISRKIDEKKK